LGADRHRITVHRWVQKANLYSTGGANPNHIAVDKTVIQLNSDRYWLYAAVDPNINRLLHVWLHPTRSNAICLMFLSKLRENIRLMTQSFSSTVLRGCRQLSSSRASIPARHT
jgi:transposase-like protein